MRLRAWILIVIAAVLSSVALLWCAQQLDLEWLRWIAFVPMFAAGTLVMRVKTLRQRRDRSREADSLEITIDRDAAARAFTVGIVATSVATAIATVMDLQAWVLGFAVLAICALAYWVIWLTDSRRVADDGDE